MEKACKASAKQAPGKPFVKGDTRIKRNVKGRPPAPKCIPDLLRWAGGLTAPDKVVAKAREVFGITEPLTVDQATILMVRLLGLQGDIRAIEFWADRTEGKAIQSIDMNATDGPLFIVLPPSVRKEPIADAANPHTETV